MFSHTSLIKSQKNLKKFTNHFESFMSSSRVSPTILSNIGSWTHTIRYEPDIKNILFFSKISKNIKKSIVSKNNVLFSCIRLNPKGFNFMHIF